VYKIYIPKYIIRDIFFISEYTIQNINIFWIIHMHSKI